MNIALLSKSQDKVQDITAMEYIVQHTDPMSAHLWGMHLPQIKLPEWLSFLNNGVVTSDGSVKALNMLGTVHSGTEVFQVTAQMVVSLLVPLMLILWAAFARKNDKLTKLGHALESLVLFVRDQLAIPNMGERIGKALTPFLCTIFFFLLLLNYISLVPGSPTVTSNIAFTAVLAVCVFVVTNIMSIKEWGLKSYLAHLTGGTHPLMWPIMIPIEVVGLFTKPFALAIRLFANMTAGHIIIYALLGLTATLGTFAIAPVSVGMSLFVYLIELLVCFLQAFIFTLLAALFIGLATESHDHGEEHAH